MWPNWLSSCFRSKDHDEEAALAGDIQLPPSYVKGCIFCDVSTEKGFNIVHENENLIVFKDRSPSAKEHLLVISKRHLASVRALRKEHIPLVRDLHSAGMEALTTLGFSPTQQRFGFHIPPFNSINHLHLHAFGLPFRSIFSGAMFPVSARAGGKGLSWFVDVGQVYDILGRDEQVKVLPC